MADANARLTLAGRRILVGRIQTGPCPIAHIAHQMGISCASASRWARDPAARRASLAWCAA
jgi:hypothetical protein